MDLPDQAAFIMKAKTLCQQCLGDGKVCKKSGKKTSLCPCPVYLGGCDGLLKMGTKVCPECDSRKCPQCKGTGKMCSKNKRPSKGCDCHGGLWCWKTSCDRCRCQKCKGHKKVCADTKIPTNECEHTWCWTIKCDCSNGRTTEGFRRADNPLGCLDFVDDALENPFNRKLRIDGVPGVNNSVGIPSLVFEWKPAERQYVTTADKGRKFMLNRWKTLILRPISGANGKLKDATQYTKVAEKNTCQDCDGRGRVKREECGRCNGSGNVWCKIQKKCQR